MISLLLSFMLVAQEKIYLQETIYIPRLLDEFDSLSDAYRHKQNVKELGHKHLKKYVMPLIGITEEDRKTLFDSKADKSAIAEIRYKIGRQAAFWRAHKEEIEKQIKDPISLINRILKKFKKTKPFVPTSWYSDVELWLKKIKTDQHNALKEWSKAAISYIDTIEELSQKFASTDSKVLTLKTKQVDEWIKELNKATDKFADAQYKTLGTHFEELLKDLNKQEPAIIDFHGLKKSLIEDADDSKSLSPIQSQQEEELESDTLDLQTKKTALKHEEPAEKSMDEKSMVKGDKQDLLKSDDQ
jgi:hypothetical protein